VTIIASKEKLFSLESVSQSVGRSVSQSVSQSKSRFSGLWCHV